MIIREARDNYRVPVTLQLATSASKYARDTKLKIESLGGQSFLLFPKNIYSGEQQIEKFLNLIEGHKVTKLSSGSIEKQATVSDSDLEKINKLSQKTLKKEDLAVYKLKVANNRVDRDQERFADVVLDSFAKSFIAKSFLFMHNKREYMPFGLVFDAWTDNEQSVKWLYAKVYVLADDETTTKYMDSGIWRYVSIGFMAPAYTVVQDTQGKFQYFEYRNAEQKEAEALEVSLVWLGAQYDAQVTKAAGNALDLMKQAIGILPAEVLKKCNTLDEVQQAIEQEQSGKTGTKSSTKHKGVRRMKTILKFLGVDRTLESQVVPAEDTQEAFTADIVKQLEAIAQKEITTLTGENTTLKAAAEKHKKAVGLYVDSLINETAGYMNDVLKFADGEREKEVTRLKALDVEALEAERDSWKAKKEARSGQQAAESKTAGGNQTAPEVASADGVQSFA